MTENYDARSPSSNWLLIVFFQPANDDCINCAAELGNFLCFCYFTSIHFPTMIEM